MIDSNLLSTARAAQLLGVSVATIKRWVDDGGLPAHKTLGGHRRIRLSDIQEFVKQNHFPHADLVELGIGEDNVSAQDLHNQWEELCKALLNNQQETVRSFILGTYKAGTPIEYLGDYLVAPAMTQVGSNWENKIIDVYQEHQATRLCESVLFELKALVDKETQGGQVLAIGGAPEHDPTVIPSLLIQILLTKQGWETRNLGPNTPLRSFRKALLDHKPRLLWVSVSHPLEQKDSFLAEFQELYHTAKEQGTEVAVGGRELSAHWRASIPYTFFGDGLSHLARFTRTLHPAYHRPTRGRPHSDRNGHS